MRYKNSVESPAGSLWAEIRTVACAAPAVASTSTDAVTAARSAAPEPRTRRRPSIAEILNMPPSSFSWPLAYLVTTGRGGDDVGARSLPHLSTFLAAAFRHS